MALALIASSSIVFLLLLLLAFSEIGRRIGVARLARWPLLALCALVAVRPISAGCRPTRVVEVQYPEVAVRARIEARVTLAVSVGPKGEVVGERVETAEFPLGGRDLFLDLVRKNVREWAFEECDPSPERSSFVSYVFRLEDVRSPMPLHRFVFEHPSTATVISQLYPIQIHDTPAH